MQRRGQKLLWDVSEACSDIERITSASSFDAYVADKDVRRLVERYLEIIGEALRQFEHVESEATSLLPDLRGWVNLRNVVAHGYDALDDKTIWGTCRSAVPKLRADVLRLLEG